MANQNNITLDIIDPNVREDLKRAIVKAEKITFISSDGSALEDELH